MMKKIFTLLIVFMSMMPVLHAQQDWQWGKRLEIMINDMAVDNQGNVYVSWDFNHAENIDGHVIQPFTSIFPSITLTNGALTSFSCDGTYRWTKVVGGGSYMASDKITVDSLGGVFWVCYAAGATYQDDTLIHIGTDTSLSPYNLGKHLLLIKLDTSGNFEWLRMPEPDMSGQNSSAGIYSMSSSSTNGLLYLISSLPPGTYADGAFQATYPMVDTPGFSSGSPIYVLKYDRFGNFQSGIHLSVNFVQSFFGAEFRKDPMNEKYYLSGYFASYENHPALYLGSSDSVTKSQYLACFDSTGAFLWFQENAKDTVHDGHDNPAYAIQGGSTTFDKAGNIYFTGGAFMQDSWSGHVISTDSASVRNFPFILKFNQNGDLLATSTPYFNANGNWGRAITYSNGVVGLALEAGWRIKWGNLDISRYNEQGWDALLGRFNAETLEPIGLHRIKSSNSSDEFPEVLTSDAKGSFYMGGTLNAAMYIGPDTIYNQSSPTDGFVAKFGFENCHCNPPTAHFSHNSIQQGTTIVFNYDGVQPVDSVIWNFGDGSSSTSINNLNINHDFVQDGRYMVCAIAYNSCGSNMYCEELAIGDVGITEIPGFAEVSVYPNPATQMLTVSGASAGMHLGIYDALGRLLQHSTLKGDKDQIDVSRLASGIYLMRFTDKQGRRGNVKFVKE